MFRKVYVAAAVLLMLVVMGAAITGCPEDISARYEVTLENLASTQVLVPVLAVTHSDDVYVFREGEAASADLVDFVNGVDTALVDTLNSLGAVTDVYLIEDGLALPGFSGDTVVFNINAKCADVISIVAPELEDPFAGLDSVVLPLPLLTRTYYMDLYAIEIGDVVLNTGPHNIVRVTITRTD